jgi:polyisoprenoid-binding protein YceI
MQKGFFSAVLAALLLSVLAAAPARAADDYVIDGMHSGVTFKISHLGLSWIYGRFDNFSGDFTIDPADPGKSTFELTIKAESIDTNNAKRDEHLRSPDFFNVKQFPVLTFKTTSVKAVNGGFEVTGDFTMHGVTKSITFPLMGGQKAEFPKGVQRTGYTTELTLKRSEFGMDKFAEALGDEVRIAISFEGAKK